MKNIRKPAETLLFVMTDTSVQPEGHQCLSRQTPVLEATEASVCPSPLTKRCRRCLRELPLSDFYLKNRLHTPDSYCKTCRKEDNRLRRKQRTCPAEAESSTAPRYPLITDTDDPELRMSLIRHALQTVRASVLRKRKRRYEEEARIED